MDKKELIKNIALRTGGDIYLGIVGGVRTGKSTFIKKFMESLVIPNIADESERRRAMDELTQSAGGKTIMTTEPKFVPNNTAKIKIDDISCNIKLIDCVGYVIPSAVGYLNDDGTTRMVQTPWFSENIPFNDAATIGTKKVIESHANIGIVVTSDGSFGEFKRHEYEAVEEKIIGELKELNKPFIIILNTVKPNDKETKDLVEEMKTKYSNSVLAIDVKNMSEADADALLKEVLNEFDISELEVHVPSYIDIFI